MPYTMRRTSLRIHCAINHLDAVSIRAQAIPPPWTLKHHCFESRRKPCSKSRLSADSLGTLHLFLEGLGSLARLLLEVLRQQVVRISKALYDLVIVDQFLQHRSKECLLFCNEALGGSSVESTMSSLAPTDFPKMSSDALLKHFHAVLAVLRVELRQVGDSSDSGQDRVVFDEC